MTKEQQAALDLLYNTFSPLGYDMASIAGIGGNGMTESGLNGDSVCASKNYHGAWQNHTSIKNAIMNQYKDYSMLNQMKYIDDWNNKADWIMNGKNAAYTATNAGKYKKAGYKTARDAADAFMRLYERPVIIKNGKVVGYQGADSRYANAEAAYQYLYNKYGSKKKILPNLQDANKTINFTPSYEDVLLSDALAVRKQPIIQPVRTLLTEVQPVAYTQRTIPDVIVKGNRVAPLVSQPRKDLFDLDALLDIGGPEDQLKQYMAEALGIPNMHLKMPSFKKGKPGEEVTDNTTVYRPQVMVPIKRQFGKVVDPKVVERLLQQQPVVKQGKSYTQRRVDEENSKRTWISDAADISHSIGDGILFASGLINPEANMAVNTAYNTVKNTAANLQKTMPVSNIERRAIEVLLRSTGGHGSGISPSEIKNAVLTNKKHLIGVLKYILTGKGNAKSLVPEDIYTGFRLNKEWDLPSIKSKSDNKEYGDIIDAILYGKQINPEYGVVPTQEPLFDFGLTPNSIKRYTNVLRYKVLPAQNNYKGLGNDVSSSEYNNITDKHLPIVFDDYGRSTRPTSISVATTNKIGADLGHYDMQIGNLNGYPVYRWQDIYEFNPSQYKRAWDLYNSDSGGDSKITMKLKNVFMDRLDKAHTPITILRNWFSDPFGWPAKNYGFTIDPLF